MKVLKISPGKKAEESEIGSSVTTEATSSAGGKEFLWISAPALTPEQLSPLLERVPMFKGKEHAFRALDEVGKVEIRGGLLCVSSLIPVPPKSGEWKITFEPITVVLGNNVVFSMGNGAEEALETFRHELSSYDHEEVAKASAACLFAGLLERYVRHSQAIIEDLKGKLAGQDEALDKHGSLDKKFLLETSSLKDDLEKMEGIAKSFSGVAERLEVWCKENQAYDFHAGEAIFRLTGRTKDLIGKLDRRENKIDGLLGTNSQMREEKRAEGQRQIAFVGVPLFLLQTGLSYFQVHDFINGHTDVAKLGFSTCLTAGLGLYLYARWRKIL
jgi:hypothetical protein